MASPCLAATHAAHLRLIAAKSTASNPRCKTASADRPSRASRLFVVGIKFALTRAPRSRTWAASAIDFGQLFIDFA
jgi:hypothetical protein